MKKRKDRVCGADVHKDLIVATIQCSDETTLREEFGMTRSELERFKVQKAANVLCRVVRAPRTAPEKPRTKVLPVRQFHSRGSLLTLKARRELPKMHLWRKRRAVLSDKRHRRIIAGTGAGKTETLTRLYNRPLQKATVTGRIDILLHDCRCTLWG